MTYFQELQRVRKFYVEAVNSLLASLLIDLKELGNDKLGSPYRNFRPHNCDCWGILSPEEEMEWHVSHIKMCLTDFEEISDFFRSFDTLIKKESERFKSKKKEVVSQLKKKAQNKGFKLWEISKKRNDGNYLFCECDILYNKNLSNSEKLKLKEQEWVKIIENLPVKSENERKRQEKNNRAQEEWERHNQEEETEFLRLVSLILHGSEDLTTLEKNYQIVKNSPLYTTSKKNFADNKEDNKTTLDNYFNTKKALFNSYKQPGENPDSQDNNHKNEEEFNNLKNKFHELYQKEKKYSQTELMTLLQILNKLEKETDLDNNFQDAKTELQIIKDKLAPYQSQICLITSRGETTKDKLKGLSKQELENGKKTLEEMEKIINLNELDKYLLEAINDELKTFGLEEEIKNLKNQKFDNPQQQAENQQKISEKEQELEKLKKEAEKKQKPTSQEIINIKNQINQLLKDHNLKVSDLPKQYQNWEEQLNKLGSKEAISSFSQKISQQINNKAKSLKREQNQKSNKQQPVSLTTKLFIGGGVAVLMASVFLVLLKKRKKTRK